MNDSIPPTWHPYSFHAMGCGIALWLDTPDTKAAQIAFAQVEALFAENEQALSRFRADSELSQLNARSGEWVSVSPLMWDVLAEALALAAITNGRFDPTLLHEVEQAGYIRSFDLMSTAVPAVAVPIAYPVAALIASGGWSQVELDEIGQAIWVPPGMGIDLGGIAKGFTAQQAVTLLQTVGPCLVDAGGDLVAGNAPHNFAGWPVSIAMPWTEEEQEQTDLFVLWLAEASLATSGIDYRRWQQNGRLSHHLIDPATGLHAETDILTTTILAHEATVAEAWATATLIAGSAAGMDALLEAEMSGLAITDNGRILVTPSMHQHLSAAAQ